MDHEITDNFTLQNAKITIRIPGENTARIFEDFHKDP